MMLSGKKRIVATSSLLVIALLAGCAPSEGPAGIVSGSVTLDGAPVGTGEISFISSDGFAASAPITGGQFKFENSLPVGKYFIIVSPPALTEAPGKGGDRIAAPKSVVPAGYGTPGASGLSQDIQEGENTVTVELSKSGPGNPK